MYLSIRNLPLTMTAKGLTLLFEKFGPLKNMKVTSDTGHAFVELDKDAGERALAELHRTELAGRTIMLYEVGERAAGFYYTPGPTAA